MLDTISDEKLLKRILIGVSYIILYEISSELINFIAGVKSGPQTVVTLFFPPIAITLAFLIYFGIWIIPLIPINMLLNTITRGRPEFVIVFYPLVNLLGYGLAGYLLNKPFKMDPGFKKLKDGISFISVTIISSLFVAYSYGFIRYIYTPDASPEFFKFSFDFFIGNIVAILTLTPLLTIVIFPFIEKALNRTLNYKMIQKKAPVFILSGILASIFSFTIYYQTFYTPSQILFLLFIPLSIIALMYGIEGSVIINNMIIFEVLTILKFVQDNNFFEFQIVIFSLSSVAIIIGVVISERTRYLDEVEKLVQERTSQLEFAIKDLQFFSYSVSHDLKVPLNTTRGIIDLLIEENRNDLSSGTNDKINQILKNNNKMEKLIDNLLEFFSLNEAELHKKSVNMLNLIKSVVDSLLKDNQNIEINFLIQDNEYYCDPSLITIVWTNLISNAIKYSPKFQKTKIEIGHLREKGKDLFFIKDNGIGFDMKDADRIFNVFQRLHPEYEGTGIGLPLVKRIIERHGGKIWATSVPDDGSTFYFSL